MKIIIINLLILMLITFYFVLYKWFISFVHELGHYLTAIFLGYSGTIKFYASKFFMPRMKTSISSNTLLKPWHDILITSAGMLFELIVSIVFIATKFSLTLRYLGIIYVMAIFLNLIPVKPKDGYYINVIIQDQKWDNKLKTFCFLIQWFIPIISIVLTYAYILNLFILYYNTHDFNLFSLSLIGFITFLTSINSVYKAYKTNKGDC